MRSLLAATVPRVVVLVFLFSGALPTVTSRALAAPFQIQHDTAYARMDLPITLGVPTELIWGLGDEEDMWFSVGSRQLELVSFDGAVQTGPLRSVAAQSDPDGSLGTADYVFGRGDIAFQLVLRLEDGALHTLWLSGRTGPMYVTADDEFGSMEMRVTRARIDRDSASLLGLSRKVSGDLPYFLDSAPSGDEGDRMIAAFGTISFDDYSKPKKPKHSRVDATAVPEPASIALAAVGLAGFARRRRRTAPHR